MALVPVIQPPIMKLLTTKKERAIVMESLRPVTKREKIIFPVAVTLIVAFIVPDATPLVGMLMLGNLFRESGVVDRLVKTASNELMNIITIMLGTVVGATATAENFLTVKTLIIVALGLIAFCFGTAGGLLLAKLMNKLSGGKINPLIGSVYPLFLWLPVFHRRSVLRRTPQTSFLCTLWDRTLLVLSVLPLPQVFF